MASNGFGSSSWWGFSPAFDFTSVLSPTPPATDSSNVINILLVGANDLRHVLKTITSCTKNTNSVQFQFFIIESHLECLARHMLFLSLLSQPKEKIGTREKSELFLELYGNSLLRSRTTQFVEEIANDLIKMTTDPDYLQYCLPMLDIASLKFKERDMLEGIFKFWRNPDEKIFDIRQHWDGRLRQYLTQRYDARTGVFDWDYHMKLEHMAPLIGSREYEEWRESGVAYKLREDAPYENSNKTLASGIIIKHSGEQFTRRGYYGDIVTSPYISFGIQCDNKEMLKKANGKFVKSCQQICEYNIQLLINLSVFGEVPPTPVEQLDTSNVPLVTIEEISEETSQHEDVKSEETSQREDVSGNGSDQQENNKGPLLNGSCKIYFLPLLYASDIGKKAKFRNFFDCVYFSNSLIHHLTSGIETTLTDNSVLVCETARYMLELKNEHMETYMEKVKGMAKSIGFTIQSETIPESAIAVFKKENPGQSN